MSEEKENLTLTILDFETGEVNVYTGLTKDDDAKLFVGSYKHSSIEWMVGKGTVNIKPFVPVEEY